MLPIIQGLWIGSELSKMELLCIKSFLYHGHEFHLYIYDPIKNIPEGVIVKDANEILAKSFVFQYNSGGEKGSFSGFANYFRYKLLIEKGNFWVDMDTICLKPFDFKEEYVFSSELDQSGKEDINGGMIMAPVGSKMFVHAFDICMSKDIKKIVFAETGPVLLRKIVDLFDLRKYIKSYKTFCPIHYYKIKDIIKANDNIDEIMSTLIKDSHSIHLWHELWRRTKLDKNAEYPESSIYQYLLNMYK